MSQDGMLDFEGKMIIVSGASSGIGKACAVTLLEHGATVVGFDTAGATINTARYMHHIVDVSDESDIQAAFEKLGAMQVFGLVNCAGVFAKAKPFYEQTVDEWNRVIGTNLTGTFLLSKYVSKEMIKNSVAGRIVNISCLRSRIFRPNMASYAASKAGVVALTAAMSLDLANSNICVNSVAPGFIYTGMTAAAFDMPEVRKASEDLIPLKRLGQPEDISSVVLFLLSDMAAYINGETIFVDGGYKILK
ncbi:SDR family NAD(P)-dependent oxidoreductase [Anaeroselena agilis]|uniref:SDR family NAD(P)-dependent oxidoreductase n=1 Tax=Anaeroselena agilis TaxID=3063788 RepID=A0ABU3P0Q3_9FIRM|nr:SDR family NAD(P)-dependent oxidoreductase [Selenomonadales bacterium 4137-cl]